MPISGGQRLREAKHRVFSYVMKGDEESRIDRAEVMMKYTWSLLQSFIPHPDTRTVGSSDNGRASPPDSSCSSQTLGQERTEYIEVSSQRLHPTYFATPRRPWTEELQSLGEALTSIYASITLHPSQRNVTEQSFRFFVSLFTSDNLERLRDGLIATRKSRCTHDVRTALRDKRFTFDEPPKILKILAYYCDRDDLEPRTMPSQIFWLHYHAELFEAWKDACEAVGRENSPLNTYIRQETGINAYRATKPPTLLKNYIVSILYPHDPFGEAARAHFMDKLEFAEQIWTLRNELDAGVLALIAAHTSHATSNTSARSLHILISLLVTTRSRVYANIVDVCEALNENIVAPVLLGTEAPKRVGIERICDLSSSELSMTELFGADERCEGDDGGEGGSGGGGVGGPDVDMLR